MKNLIVTVSVLFVSLSAFAGPTLGEKHLVQVLQSTELETFKAENGFEDLVIQSIEIDETENRRFRSAYDIKMFYSALGTAGGCFLTAKVALSQMEIVDPAGGFQAREIFKIVGIQQGMCPR